MSPLRSLLVVLAVWAVIYLPGLGTLEIKGEEGRRILPAVTMLETGNYLVPFVGSDPYFTKPPLINWLVAASFQITGRRSEWSARLPSALCVLAVALAFIAVARRSLGAKGSLIAALVWMTNFGILEKGRLIELEALYVSLTGLAFICWLSWWQEQRSRWLTWTVPWIFLGLGILAKGPLHLVFFYAVLIGVLFHTRRLGALLHPAHFIGILIMLGIFAAWAIPCLQMMATNDVAHTWTRQFSGRLSGEDFKFAGWILNIPRGLGYFLPWTLLFLFVRRERTGDGEENVSIGLAWGIGVSFLAVSLLPGSLARYTMPLLAPACRLVASLLASAWVEFPRWLRLRWPAALPFELRWPALITSLTCAAILIYAVALMPMLRSREKIRNIAAEINAALPAGEALYAVDPDYQPFLFYVRGPILYCQQVKDIPATARFLLLQPKDEGEALESRQWMPRHAATLLRLRDYRKKEVILLGLR
ncbi:MAG: glycosyltransferase family 39 protein [Chthoniobacterales bacterium]